MEPKFSVQTKINKPIGEVFDAVINPQKIVGYFCDKTDAPLVEGQTVNWTWTNHGTQPVQVKQIIPNSKIVIEWPAETGNTTIAEMSFSSFRRRSHHGKNFRIRLAVERSGTQSQL